MFFDELTAKYIEEHEGEDVRTLALRKAPAGVDVQRALRQIAARQTMRKKVPLWVENGGVVYPRQLSVEQCSSQRTAEFKAEIAGQTAYGRGFRLVDLTGGMGVDCYFMSAGAGSAVYVERDEELCAIAEHNFGVLGREVSVRNMSAEEWLAQAGRDSADVVYLDPARRDENGHKVVSVSDCSPDVSALRERLLEVAPDVLVKLSPMLDISLAVRQLERVQRVYVVSVQNECKELLLHLRKGCAGECGIECVNFGADGRMSRFAVEPGERCAGEMRMAESVKRYLYEPDSAIMKAGVFGAVCAKYQVEKLHPNSHLFTSERAEEGFPGRVFSVERVVPFSKSGMAEVKRAAEVANVAVRNFPMAAEALRKRLGVKDGGEVYLFGTTLNNGDKVLIMTKKVVRQRMGDGDGAEERQA